MRKSILYMIGSIFLIISIINWKYIKNKKLYQKLFFITNNIPQLNLSRKYVDYEWMVRDIYHIPLDQEFPRNKSPEFIMNELNNRLDEWNENESDISRDYILEEIYNLQTPKKYLEKRNKRNTITPGYPYHGTISGIIEINDNHDCIYIDPFITGDYSVVSQSPRIFGRGWTSKRFTGSTLMYHTIGISWAILVSSGPDGKYESFDGKDMSSVHKLKLYDPTNGLYSEGDIVFLIGGPPCNEDFTKLRDYKRKIVSGNLLYGLY